jgi:hypothetical protein
LLADADRLRAELEAEAHARRNAGSGAAETRTTSKAKRIPAEHRTIPMSLSDAAKLMGYTSNAAGERIRRIKDAVELLSKSIKDGSIRAEKQSRQRYVFDRTDFPEESRPKIIPKASRNSP